LRDQIQKTGAGNPELPAMLKFIATPEFRAGFMLTGIAMAAGFLLALSTLGGAVSGMLRTRRKLSV
jgi:hypothetical protein